MWKIINACIKVSAVHDNTDNNQLRDFLSGFKEIGFVLNLFWDGKLSVWTTFGVH